MSNLTHHYHGHDPNPVIAVKSALSIVTTLGNLWIILSVVTTKHLRRTPNNIFILSLAVVDMLVGGLAVVPDIVPVLIPLTCWHYHTWDLNVVDKLRFFLMLVSEWNLCVISYDRYRFVSDSFRYSTWMTRCRLTVFVIVPWLVPALFCAIKVLLYPNTQLIVMVIMKVVMYFLPLIIITLSYIRILIVTRKGARAISHAVKQHRTNLQNQQKAIQRTSYIIGLLVGALYLLLLPGIVYDLYISITHLEPDCVVTDVVDWLAYTNSTVNPFVYTVFNKAFRAAMVRVISCKSEREQLATLATTPHYIDTPRNRPSQKRAEHQDMNYIHVIPASDEHTSCGTTDDDKTIRAAYRAARSVGSIGYFPELSSRGKS